MRFYLKKQNHPDTMMVFLMIIIVIIFKNTVLGIMNITVIAKKESTLP